MGVNQLQAYRKTVITRQGGEGRVTRVTRGGIQVYFATSKTTRPYPLRKAFNTGELRFKESALQGEMMRSLRGTARVGGLTPPVAEPASREPRVSAVNVPDNVRLVCFFKNADDDKYLSHMKRVGPRDSRSRSRRAFRETLSSRCARRSTTLGARWSYS